MFHPCWDVIFMTVCVIWQTFWQTVCCATPPLLIYCAWLRIKIQTLKRKHMGWVRIHYRTWLCLCSFVYLPNRVNSPGYNSWHDAIPPPQKSFKVRRGTRPEDDEQPQQFGQKKSPLESRHRTNTKQWLKKILWEPIPPKQRNLAQSYNWIERLRVVQSISECRQRWWPIEKTGLLFMSSCFCKTGKIYHHMATREVWDR